MKNGFLRLSLILLTATLMLVSSVPVHADPADPEPPLPQAGSGRDWWFGVRFGGYFDVDEPAVGGELLFPVNDRLFFNPNVEFVLVDNADYITFNGDFHYDLPVEGRAMAWVGAGLAAVYFDPDGPIDGDTDLGGNFFAGLGYNGDSIIPYVQGKLLVTGDNSEFVLMAGVRF